MRCRNVFFLMLAVFFFGAMIAFVPSSVKSPPDGATADSIFAPPENVLFSIRIQTDTAPFQAQTRLPAAVPAAVACVATAASAIVRNILKRKVTPVGLYAVRRTTNEREGHA